MIYSGNVPRGRDITNTYRPLETHGAPSRLLDTHSRSPVETKTGGLYAVSKRRFILVRALPRANSTSPTLQLLQPFNQLSLGYNQLVVSFN